MSADNGVYILKTGKQYRVAQVKGIDRLHWDSEGNYHEEMVNNSIIDIFGNCKFTHNAENAFGIACAINDENYSEYGIVLLNAHKTWRQILDGRS